MLQSTMGGFKGVILIGGPSTGTRFRPLSFQVVKPLFPIAGIPMIQHHLEALQKVGNIEEVLLIGFYEEAEVLPFVTTVQEQFPFRIRYLREYQPLGTGGGLFHFRDVILSGSPELFFVMHADIASTFPLKSMLQFHRDTQALVGHSITTIMACKKDQDTSLRYGCMVVHQTSSEMLHYVEKPDTFISDVINAGVYIFTPEIFRLIGQVFVKKHSEFGLEGSAAHQLRKQVTTIQEIIQLEQDVLMPSAGQGQFYVYKLNKDDFWCQIKGAESVLEANKQYLALDRKENPEVLAKKGPDAPEIVGNVLINKSASVHPTSKIGPNVVISARARIGAGVRISNSIVLDDVSLKDNSCIMNSVIGWRTRVGMWTRVQGTYGTHNEEVLFAHGKKNPGVTCIGQDVLIGNELIVRDCIVLPHKQIFESCHNEIVL